MATAKGTLDAIEETAEAIDETLNQIEQNKSLVIPVAVVVGVAGLLVGGTAGWVFAKRHLKTKYEKLAIQEIAEAKLFYQTLYKTDKLATPEGAVEERVSAGMAAAAKALSTYSGEGEDEPDVTVVRENVFAKAEVEVEFDLEVEKKNRTETAPYIISHDEYMEAEPGYDQQVLTYYEGDETLADERDEPIMTVDEVVGEDHLQRFGYGSGDPNTVFIRNDRLTLDFEVTRSEGKFSHEVLGLQHSDDLARRDRRVQNQPRRFRGGDE